jgi:hypothetical protein
MFTYIYIYHLYHTLLNRLFEQWFTYMDTLLDKKLISRTLFTFNHHALSHLGALIRRLGNLLS